MTRRQLLPIVCRSATQATLFKLTQLLCMPNESKHALYHTDFVLLPYCIFSSLRRAVLNWIKLAFTQDETRCNKYLFSIDVTVYIKYGEENDW